METTKNTFLRDLINKDDYQYNEIPENMTVGELRTRMKSGEQYYDIVPVDSIIREIHFDAISNAFDIDYDEVYNTRMD